ncbi:hypothetical protein CDL12_15888 [Handroanthus impetiginosus]|uniref:Uncharacterized protein n=1 Tax=Handroanthus impetiginosus TaxID=429701 RepID=A0A2G9H1W3_9LAMI|nr:hypothetical protein CDL12_15888 [Handroanthus impetiginosus]
MVDCYFLCSVSFTPSLLHSSPLIYIYLSIYHLIFVYGIVIQVLSNFLIPRMKKKVYLRSF